MVACLPHLGETSVIPWGVLVPDTSPHHPQNIGGTTCGRAPCPMRSRNRRHDASPTEKTRSGRPSSHTPIQAKRFTPDSQAPPFGRDETIEDRPNRPLSRNKAVRTRNGAQSRTLQPRPSNREAPGGSLTLLTIPQRTTDHPDQPQKRRCSNRQ